MQRGIWRLRVKIRNRAAVFSKAFIAAAVVTGVILVSAVTLVSSYVGKRNRDNKLASEIEYIKRQYSNYIEYNNTEAAKSLIMKAESAKLIRDCDKEESTEALKKHAEEVAATGITVVDENLDVLAEYTKDGTGFEQFRHMLNTDTLMKAVEYDNYIYLKRIRLGNSSWIDVAAEKCSSGALLVYRHTLSEYAAKSILSIQNLLDGYDKEQNGTFVIMDGAEIIASNDRSLLSDVISEEDYNLVYAFRNSGRADEMITLKKEGENQRYFGRFSHGREFYICAFLSERQIYSNILPLLAVTVVLYVLCLAVVQFIRLRTANRLISEKQEQEHLYKLELEQKNAELTEAVDTAEAANRSKQVFLFNMSHDIRTPMNAIIGFTNLAQQNMEDGEKVRDYLGKIMTSSRHLLALINDILDMSRIENGKVSIETVPVCITDQMELVKDVVHSDIESKGLTYVEKKVDLEDVYVYADALHVNRVLINILSNAVKFTPEGGTITYTMRERKSENEGSAYYDFIIEDTGIGMSEEFRRHIFEQFARERTSTVSHTQGTGLGMSITKSLVDLMGGDISVQSEEGKGSVFTVTLEFRLTTEDKVRGNTAGRSFSADKDLSGRRVLLVEDNDLNMEIASTLLKTMGLTVETAWDGLEALNRLKEHPSGYYDLILMDIQMPVMNGYDTTRAIRALEDSAKADIPVIAMTANAFEEDRMNAYAAGMNDHIAKPLDVSMLKKVITDQIHQH